MYTKNMDDKPTIVSTLVDLGVKNSGLEIGKATPFSLLITVILALTILILVISMNRHLSTLPKSFDNQI